MLELAITCFVIALIAGALGFTGVARGFAKIAKFLFVLFLVLAVIALIVAVFFVGALA